MRALITLVATVAFVLAPQVTPDFSGYNPGMFPVEIPRPSVQPAGYAFAIWGVIFTWLLVYAGMGMIRRTPEWDLPRLPYVASVLIGSVWLAVASSAPITATVLILMMGACTFAAFLMASPSQSRWLIQAPLALYAGWLTAACSVSLGVILAGYGILSDTASALTMLAVVLVTAIAMQRLRPTMPVYSVAVIWAALGIVQVNWQPNPTVAWAALGGAALLTAAALILALQARNRPLA